MDIPDKSFLVNNIEHSVPCIFQIWEKKSFDRPVLPKLSPENFTFVTKHDNPDISFRRVGINAGKIDTNVNKSPQSHYFIKFTNRNNLQDIIQKLSTITFESNNTVGPKSISSQEIIKEFNPIL
jgi:hypothetical protein